MYFLQGGVCAIEGCDNEATCVDHNHDSGEIRKMLCIDCNTNIAVLEDPLFTSYIKYLANNAVQQKQERN